MILSPITKYLSIKQPPSKYKSVLVYFTVEHLFSVNVPSPNSYWTQMHKWKGSLSIAELHATCNMYIPFFTYFMGKPDNFCNEGYKLTSIFLFFSHLKKGSRFGIFRLRNRIWWMWTIFSITGFVIKERGITGPMWYFIRKRINNGYAIITNILQQPPLGIW